MDQIKNKKLSLLNSDRNIVNEIEKMLPQSDVRFFVDRLLYDTVYDYVFAQKLEIFYDRSKDIGFEIQDPAIKNALNNLRGELKELENILVIDFGPDSRRKNIFSIHPNRKEQSGYLKLLKSLKNKTNEFHESYKKFLEIAYKKFRSVPFIKSNDTGQKRKIFKDDHGNYFIEDKGIEMPQNTLYYHVFDIAISNADQNNLVSYSKIQAELKKRIMGDKIEGLSVKDAEIGKEAEKKRIQNSLGQLFKHAKINNKPLTNDLRNSKIFTNQYGMGYKIYNPLL